MSRVRVGFGAMLLVSSILAACAPEEAGPLRIYTTVTQETVDVVVAGFEQATGQDVEVLRLPTGELNARIASEMRTGGLTADVLWLTDPLSMHQYETDGLLVEWRPDGAERVDPAFRTPSTWGTRVLNLVIVVGSDLAPTPDTWADLATMPGPVAFPDPAFAGSAFAALGYFGLTDDLDFYRDLREANATQVQAPGEVVTGVAEGRFTAGITLDFSARDAIEDGSPIRIVWPETGAIAFHSPIALVDDTDAGRSFVEYVLADEGQLLIGQSGWQPVVSGAGGPAPGGPQVTFDWARAFDRQDELLESYRELFGS